MTLPPPAATDAQVPTPAPELARVTAQRDAARAANHGLLEQAALDAERIAALEEQVAEREGTEGGSMASLQKLLHLAAEARRAGDWQEAVINLEQVLWNMIPAPAAQTETATNAGWEKRLIGALEMMDTYYPANVSDTRALALIHQQISNVLFNYRQANK